MAEYSRLDANGLLFLLQQLKGKIDAVKTVITSGSANGTISVDGSDVEVKGLKNAAYKDVTASVAADNTDPVTSGAVYTFVTNAIADVESFSAVIVETLPAVGKTNVMYLVPKTGGGYTEYLYINNTWELIGSTDIDLSGYVKASEMKVITNAEITDIVNQVWG